MKKGFSAILCLVLLFAVVVNVTGKGVPEKKDQLTFVMVPKLVHPFYEPCFEGFQEVGKELGVITEFLGPKDATVDLQVGAIENLISRGVDGITISATDDVGLKGVVDEALRNGIKVITFDSDAPSTNRQMYIGTDNRAAGKMAAQKMIELMGSQGGEVALLLATLSATNLLERAEEFEKAFKEAGPQYKVVAIESFSSTYDVAMDVTESLIQSYPNLRGIFGICGEGGPAAATVVKEFGLADKIIVGGFSDLMDTLLRIRDGSLKFTLVQNAYSMGTESTRYLYKLVKGESYPEILDTGVILVDIKNVDTYKEDLKKL